MAYIKADNISIGYEGKEILKDIKAQLFVQELTLLLAMLSLDPLISKFQSTAAMIQTLMINFCLQELIKIQFLLLKP